METKRLTIRLLTDAEMETLIISQTDAGIQAAYGEMLAGCLAHPGSRQWYAVWQIALTDGTPVGDLCFKGVSGDGTVEIGYGIYPEYEGKGYMTEAVTAMTQWAATQPGVKRVEAETEPDNGASQRVLSKAGYVPTGTMGEEGPRFVYVG